MISEYCRALNETENTRPFDELDHGEISITPSVIAERLSRPAAQKGAWYAYAAWEPGSVISGTTEIIHLPFEKDRIQQWFTGVRPAYRGRGLGKWLKAAMLEHVVRRYPELKWVITGNANSNEPMLAINRKLGFRPNRACVMYQISKQNLRVYASGSGGGQE